VLDRRRGNAAGLGQLAHPQQLGGFGRHRAAP
jgi:hypothetical protein